MNNKVAYMQTYWSQVVKKKKKLWLCVKRKREWKDSTFIILLDSLYYFIV